MIFLLTEVFQLSTEERIIKLEYYNFPTLNEIMDLGNDHQWLLRLQKEVNQFLCASQQKNTVSPKKYLKNKKIKPASAQTFRSNYQYTEDSGDGRMC